MTGFAPARRSPACYERHRHYLLTCDELTELRDRCANRCEICGLPGERNDRGSLFIDHDGSRGYWAVRGLLCNRCNTLLGKAPSGALTDEQRAYLANAWFRRFDLSLEIEPAGAVEVWGRWDTRFQRRRNGWYDPRRHLTVTWRELWRTRGAHLVVTGYTRETIRRLADAERKARPAG